MSTAMALSAPADLLAARPAAERGRLTVAKRVIEKITVQAAAELVGTGQPKVEARLDGTDAWLVVEVGLNYPAPLREAAEQLREHLIKRVERLSGVGVRRLDIKVGWLIDPEDAPRRLA